VRTLRPDWELNRKYSSLGAWPEREIRFHFATPTTTSSSIFRVSTVSMDRTTKARPDASPHTQALIARAAGRPDPVPQSFAIQFSRTHSPRSRLYDSTLENRPRVKALRQPPPVAALSKQLLGRAAGLNALSPQRDSYSPQRLIFKARETTKARQGKQKA
jgi:hypothetical protein